MLILTAEEKRRQELRKAWKQFKLKRKHKGKKNVSRKTK
jgi:hypothetical protein